MGDDATDRGAAHVHEEPDKVDREQDAGDRDGALVETTTVRDGVAADCRRTAVTWHEPRLPLVVAEGTSVGPEGHQWQ